MTALRDRPAAVVFVLLVLLTSLLTADVAEGLVLALSPLLVTLVMLLVVTRDGWSRAGWARLGPGVAGFRWWPAALAATVGVSLVATAAPAVGGVARLVVPSGDWLSTALVLLVTAPLLAFTEEIGWRGYLYSRLETAPEAVRVLVTGAVWTLWHLPYILLTPYYHSGGDRAVVLVLFTGSVLAFSWLFDRLRRRSGSVWVAVLAHAGHNAAFGWLGDYVIRTDRPVLVTEYLAGDTGLLVLVGTAVAAVVVGVTPRRRVGAHRR